MTLGSFQATAEDPEHGEVDVDIALVDNLGDHTIEIEVLSPEGEPLRRAVLTPSKLVDVLFEDVDTAS
jgi:hypothetical protein